MECSKEQETTAARISIKSQQGLAQAKTHIPQESSGKEKKDLFHLRVREEEEMGAYHSSAYDAKRLPTRSNEPAPIKKVEARGFPAITNESAPIKKVEARGFPTIANESTPTKKGQVMTFRSSSKWKIHFEASKQTSKLIVIDFTASWCGPCQYIQPAINEFAEKYTDVEFIKIDVDELHDVAEEFGVQAMPTFILIKKGKEVDKVVGAKKDDLQKKIEKHRS